MCDLFMRYMSHGGSGAEGLFLLADNHVFPRLCDDYTPITAAPPSRRGVRVDVLCALHGTVQWSPCWGQEVDLSSVDEPPRLRGRGTSWCRTPIPQG